MANKGQAYGDLAERQAKLAAKYDPALEKDLTSWVEKETGTKLEGTFQSWLKSGVVLCKLMNKLSPDSCKNVHTGEMSFKQMENIGKFLTACPAYGVASEYLFQTPDLYEDKNMTGVLVTLDNVRRIQGTKAKGGKVEAVTVKESPMLRKGPTKAEDFKLGRPEDPRKNMPDLYDRSNAKEVVNAVGGGKDGAFGDLAERLAVIDLKYDKNLESAIRVWIEHETKEKIGDDFQAGLKNGVILCKLMNKLSPNSVPSINQGNLAFKQMENINNFLQAAGAFGVKAEDLFQTVALYEGSNMTQVLLTLSNLKRVASSK